MKSLAVLSYVHAAWLKDHKDRWRERVGATDEDDGDRK